MVDIEIVKGDITKMEVDAIVNSSNTSLLSGGDNGVNGAIYRAGGPEIEEACKVIRIKMGGCAIGEAVVTTAGNLPAKYVIHAAGPVWKGGKNNEAELLANCYINSIKMASQHQVATIAFPNISTGIYGFPREMAANIAIDAVYSIMIKTDVVKKVYFVCYNDENYQIYKRLMES